MIICWNSSLDILSKIKLIIKINFAWFFFFFFDKCDWLLENLKLAMWFISYFHWTVLL